MEIERKYLVDKIPFSLDGYHLRLIEQGYLCSDPVVRVRRDNDDYYLTYKGSGLLTREEYNLPITKEAYEHMIEKADGNVITKKRYEIPEKDGLTIELDIFEGVFEGLIFAEVEFDSVEAANAYIPPKWFSRDVTECGEYTNCALSYKGLSS